MAEQLAEHPDNAGTSPPLRILIVEDDADLAAMLGRWVRDHYGDAVDVSLAHSIEEGKTVLADLPTVDVVLLDRHFPQGSGDDLLNTLQRDFDPIVVMITGVEPNTELIRLPVADYLVKPLERGSLIKRLALLEKLDTSGALEAYANARKASLLEFHLDEPDDDPLFRRFAARWSYDRLEAAATSDRVYVYELYLDDAAHRDRVEVSLAGTLAGDLADLIAEGALVPVGELVPSGDELAWIDTGRGGDPPDDGYVIYEFADDMPEQYVDPTVDVDSRPVERELEQAYR